MGLFDKAKQTQGAPAQPVKHPLVAKYDGARSNLLAMLAFTVINFILTITQADMYFLFSATFPQASLLYGYVLEAEGLTGFYTAGIVLGVVCIGLYCLCWLLSKKNAGWMIVATVLFAIDTLLLFLAYEIQADMILDVVFHAWVLYYLISGVVANAKMKKLPPEELAPPVAPPAEAAVNPEVPAQPPVMVINGEPVAMELAQEEK